MKIRFRVVTSRDYEAAPDPKRVHADAPRLATLEIVVKYQDRGHRTDETSAAFARKTFDIFTDDEEIAEWAATTMATCLRGLVPENERC